MNNFGTREGEKWYIRGRYRATGECLEIVAHRPDYDFPSDIMTQLKKDGWEVNILYRVYDNFAIIEWDEDEKKWVQPPRIVEEITIDEEGK